MYVGDSKNEKKKLVQHQRYAFGRELSINVPGNVAGSVVYIRHVKHNEVLTLCEVQVFGKEKPKPVAVPPPKGERLALGRPCAQSSGTGCFKMNDGSDKSCYGSKKTRDPWVRFDLGGYSQVENFYVFGLAKLVNPFEVRWVG